MDGIGTIQMMTEYEPFEWLVTGALHGGLPLGTGFVIGLLAGGLVVQRLYRKSAEGRLEAFTLTDVFDSRVGSDVWDPFHVRTTLEPDGETTNTECVLRVLLANEGRMRQADIADATGWSDATVSRLLSRMERDGDVSRVTVGQRKLVFLGDLRREDHTTPSPSHEAA